MSDPQPILEPDHCYHIFNHAVGHENLFENDTDYLYFLKKLRLYVVPVCEVLSYCLLPNHFHLAIRIKSERKVEEFLETKYDRGKIEILKESNKYFFSEQISKSFSNLFNTYSKY